MVRGCRAQRTDNKEWVYGFVACPHSWEDGVVDTYEFNEYKDGKTTRHIIVDANTVEECTELPDKNGKKIFEGDIVRWCRKDISLVGNYTYCFQGYKYGDELVVRCLDSGFMLCPPKDSMPDVPNANGKIDNYALWNMHRFLEVVGNTHDNPELLEEEN